MSYNSSEFHTPSKHINGVKTDGSVSLSMNDDGSNIKFENYSHYNIGSQSSHKKFPSLGSDIKNQLFTHPSSDTQNTRDITTSDLNDNSNQDEIIPILFIVDGEIKEFFPNKGEVLQILFNTKIYKIDTKHMEVFHGLTKINLSQKSGRIKQGNRSIGPACIWLLSRASDRTAISLNCINGVFHAKCNEDCIIMGVSINNFNS